MFNNHKCIYFDFKNLVRLNGKIHIYNYEIKTGKCAVELIYDKLIENINKYYPKRIDFLEKVKILKKQSEVMNIPETI